MIDALEIALRLAVWSLTAVAWGAAWVLIRAARRARIGALTERSVVAVVIAAFGTLYGLVMFNAGLALVSHEVMTAAIRGGVLLLLLVPAYWAWMYLTGRLGDDR